MTAQVQNRQHRDEIRVRREEHAEGKVAKQRASDAWLDDRKLKWVLQESGENGVTCASNRKPKPARSRSYRRAASKISSSASDETSSRHI